MLPDFLIDIDPIKWLDDAIQTMRLGSGVKLTWPPGAATGTQVENMLRKYGVKVYKRQYTNGKHRDYGVTVRSEQAIWAQTLLDKFLAGGNMPKEWGVPAKPQGWGGIIADWLSGGVQ